MYYYIAYVNDLSQTISPELDNLTIEAAMSWMENVGNIIEYTIVQRG
jgi:hypothetical protein